MGTIRRFEEIKAWQTGRELANLIYAFSKHGNLARDFGLKDQMRRAAVSIISNIAEGYESRTQAQFINYLGTAKASAGEVRAQLYIALDQKYLSQEQFQQAFNLAEKASRQIHNFIAYLQSHPNSRKISEDTIAYNV